MSRPPRLLLALLASLAMAPAPALAEEIVLAERHRPGDAFALSLSTYSRTQASSRRPDLPRVDEELELRYDASVLVLEVDASGRPVRERHENVSLTTLREGELRSLLPTGASYELLRGEDGALGLRVEGRRLESPREAVSRALAARFETGPLPSILAPGRPVETGESWELRPADLRRLLAERGLRVVEFGGPATARFERFEGDGPHDRILRYQVPLAWFELEEMPPDTEGAHSRGRLVGSILFSATRRGVPVDHRSHLEATLGGAVLKRRVARPFAWKLHAVRSSLQHTRPIASSLSSAF